MNTNLVLFLVLTLILVSYPEVSAQESPAWSIQTIDTRSSLYGGISITLDSNNNPHICYVAFTSFEPELGDPYMMYARWNGTAWNTQRVVSNGWGAAIALDSNNNPHIIYALENRLMYASLFGSSWSIQTVDSSEDGFWHISLVLDNKDNPHIIYYDHTGQVGYGSGDTRYAS